MTARQFWLGLMLIVGSILAHALLPRYEWRQGDEVIWLRIDRWTGSMEAGHVTREHPAWRPLEPRR